MALTDTKPEGSPKRQSILPLILRITTVGIVAAALYVGWTFYSRHERTAEAERAIDRKKQDDQKRVNSLIFGSGEVKLSTFSIGTSVLKRGETTQLCYGVVNATSVKLDPPPTEALKPSYRHCFDIAPTKTTTYTLTASNGKGDTKTASLTLKVQ